MFNYYFMTDCVPMSVVSGIKPKCNIPTSGKKRTAKRML